MMTQSDFSAQPTATPKGGRFFISVEKTPIFSYNFLMQKNFDQWNERKKKLNDHADRVFFHEREVWWCALGVNIGFEMDGKSKEYSRPVIVLKKYNHYSFLALPLSTSKTTNKYRIPVGPISGKEAAANLSQVRNIDSKRLIKKIGRIELDKFEEIKKRTSQINFS